MSVTVATNLKMRGSLSASFSPMPSPFHFHKYAVVMYQCQFETALEIVVYGRNFVIPGSGFIALPEQIFLLDVKHAIFYSRVAD